MLQAESAALENRASRLMLQIREKELNYLTNKYNAIGLQSALVGGFTVNTLTNLSLGHHLPLHIRWMFFAFSCISLACSISCILNTTFVVVWGPGLALRGRDGSMARAYYGMLYEQSQIFGTFVSSLFFFALQSIIAFWIIDSEDNSTTEYYSLFATFIMLIGMTCAIYWLVRMYNRFQALSVEEEDGYGDGQSGSMASEKKKAPAFPEATRHGAGNGGRSNGTSGGSSGSGSGGDSVNGAILSNFSGYLSKKSRQSAGRKYFQYGTGDAYAWKVRFFVLDSGRMLYYENEDEWRTSCEARNANAPIVMENYEVLVRPTKANDWGFMLENVGSVNNRDYELRAETEETRLKWVKVLLNVSVSIHGRGQEVYSESESESSEQGSVAPFEVEAVGFSEEERMR